MPRPRKAYQRERLSLQLNAGVVRTFNEATVDLLRDRPEHGKRAEIVESLIRNWLEINGYTETLNQYMKEAER